MSVSWFDGVTLQFEIAFDSTADDESPTWTDVSAWVRRNPAIKISPMGRRSQYGDMSPGTCEFALGNADRRFDPTNVGGPFYGKLLPMRQVRITATFAAVSSVLFLGNLQGYPQIANGPTDSYVQIRCVDQSRRLSNALLYESAYIAEVMTDDPLVFYPGIGDENDQNGFLTTVKDYTTNGYDGKARGNEGTYPGAIKTVSADYPIDAAYAYTPVNDWDVSSEGWGWSNVELYDAGASLWPGAPVSLDGWFRINDTSDTKTTSIMTVRDYFNNGFTFIVSHSSVNILYYDYTAQEFASGGTTVTMPIGEWFHVAFTRDASNGYAYLNGQLVATETFSSGTIFENLFDKLNITMGANAQNIAISNIAIYHTTPLTAARIQAHYNAGVSAWGHPHGERTGGRVTRVLDEAEWPATRRSVSTGKTIVGEYHPGSQSALSILRVLEAAEQGYAFVDRDGDFVFRDRQFLWTDATAIAPQISILDGGADIVVDANSIEALRNVFSVETDNGTIHQSDTTSVNEYGDVLESVSVGDISRKQAKNLALYGLSEAKEPRSLIPSVTVKPRRDPTVMFPQVLDLRVGYRAAVSRHAQGQGDPFTYQAHVTGYTHTINQDNWVTELYLSPAPRSYIEAPWLQIGDDVFGVIGLADQPLLDENGDALLDENGDPLYDDDTTAIGNLIPY